VVKKKTNEAFQESPMKLLDWNQAKAETLVGALLTDRAKVSANNRRVV
jgi:hypothetical protein